MTPDAFNTWRKSFTAELQRKREKEEEDRIKAMAPKEREEYKRRRERLTGEHRVLASGIALVDNADRASPFLNLYLTSHNGYI